ncbi:hypothetical protein FOS14_09540 [Skermania sp. ID1734]|nr:hypothetical protein FOS14_09540 [Skermania sp. ID1734]
MRPNLAALATAQWGVFTFQQARASYTDGEIRTLIRRGDWVRVFRGVYRQSATTPDVRLMLTAASLTLGAPVAACHDTAAQLHGFGVLDSPKLHVVDPGCPNVATRVGCSPREDQRTGSRRRRPHDVRGTDRDRPRAQLQPTGRARVARPMPAARTGQAGALRRTRPPDGQTRLPPGVGVARLCRRARRVANGVANADAVHPCRSADADSAGGGVVWWSCASPRSRVGGMADRTRLRKRAVPQWRGRGDQG